MRSGSASIKASRDFGVSALGSTAASTVSKRGVRPPRCTRAATASTMSRSRPCATAISMARSNAGRKPGSCANKRRFAPSARVCSPSSSHACAVRYNSYVVAPSGPRSAPRLLRSKPISCRCRSPHSIQRGNNSSTRAGRSSMALACCSTGARHPPWSLSAASSAKRIQASPSPSGHSCTKPRRLRRSSAAAPAALAPRAASK